MASTSSLLEALDATGTRNEAFIACRREYFDFSTSYYNQKGAKIKLFRGYFRESPLVFCRHFEMPKIQ